MFDTSGLETLNLQGALTNSTDDARGVQASYIDSDTGYLMLNPVDCLSFHTAVIQQKLINLGFPLYDFYSNLGEKMGDLGRGVLEAGIPGVVRIVEGTLATGMVCSLPGMVRGSEVVMMVGAALGMGDVLGTELKHLIHDGADIRRFGEYPSGYFPGEPTIPIDF